MSIEREWNDESSVLSHLAVLVLNLKLLENIKLNLINVFVLLIILIFMVVKAKISLFSAFLDISVLFLFIATQFLMETSIGQLFIMGLLTYFLHS